jgi:hypothetical protein
VIHIISQREKRRSLLIDTYCNKAIDVEHKMYYLFNKKLRFCTRKEIIKFGKEI